MPCYVMLICTSTDFVYLKLSIYEKEISSVITVLCKADFEEKVKHLSYTYYSFLLFFHS